MTAFVHQAALKNCWYPVIDAADVADSPVAIRLLGEDLVIWRSANDDVVVVPDRCPHREAPLSIGSLENGVLSCAYHGWAFGNDGQCVAIPSSGPDATIAPTAHLSCRSAEERYGLVWICPGIPDLPIPEIPQETDPSFRRINTGVDVWAVSTPRMVDNFLDVSHFPYVHTGTFGGAQEAKVPKIDLSQLDDFFGYAYEVDAFNPDEAQATSGSTDDVVHRQMSTGFALPFSVRSTIRYEDGLEHILLLCSTPVDDLTSLFTFVVWRNDDRAADPEETIAFDRAIGAEDKVMLERVPGTLPLGRTDLVSVQSDKPSVEWRRRFSELVGQDGEATRA